MGELLLDERMIVWVFIPIIYVACAIQLFRLFYTLYGAYTTTKKAVKKAQGYCNTKNKALVAKCDHLAKKFMFLTREAFDCRRGFLCKPEKGYLLVNGNRPPVNSINSMQAAQSRIAE